MVRRGPLVTPSGLMHCSIIGSAAASRFKLMTRDGASFTVHSATRERMPKIATLSWLGFKAGLMIHCTEGVTAMFGEIV